MEGYVMDLKHDPALYREWLLSNIKELADDFFGWLEDDNLEEYCLGGDTAKYCRDKGVRSFEDWLNS